MQQLGGRAVSRRTLQSLALITGFTVSAGRPARCFPRRLRFERLEDRRVLAAFTVTSLSDAAVTGPGSAPGTLRQAIYDANNSPGDDTIQFAANLICDINLSAIDDTALGPSALLVTSQIKILGNANGITIQR